MPVIAPADHELKLLSFANLCELHVLRAITRRHSIPLQQVRSALQNLRNELKVDRPLLDRDFLTNGVDLFLDFAGDLLNVSQRGQTALRGQLEAALSRIERNSSGRPIRLFPFSRAASAGGQPSVVAIDPRIGFGRPVVIPGRVRTEVIIDRNALGDALRANAVAFVAHKELFAPDSPDGEWIQRASDERWIGITRDQNIRRKPNEIGLIRASNAMICVVTSGNLSAAPTAEILLKALPKILELYANGVRPAIHSIHRDGKVTLLSVNS